MGRRIARLLRKALIGLALLVLGVLVLAQGALEVAPVRRWIRDQVVPLAGKALKARVEIDAIESLSLIDVRARGVRVKSQQGAMLASAERAYVRVNPLLLVFGRLRLSRIELEQPYVDLGAPGGAGGGLLGLFQSDDTSQQGTPQPSSGGGLRVELADVRIEHGRAGATLGDARFSVHQLDFRGDVRVTSDFALGVQQLECELRRNDRHIGAIRSTQGERTLTGEAKLKLDADVAGGTLKADATLGRATSTGAQPVRALIEVSGVSGEMLQRLGVDGDWLTAPVDLELRANGTTAELNYASTLRTPGGTVDIGGRFVAPGALAVTVRTARIAPHRFLRADVAPLHGVVRAHAEQNAASGVTALVLAVDDAAYAGAALPRVDARGQWSSAQGLTLEQLDAVYPAGSVNAHGSLARDGTLELLAHVQSRALGQLPPLRRLAPGLSGALAADLRVAKEKSGALQAQVSAALQRPAFGTTRAVSMHLRGELNGPSIDAARVHAQLLSNDVDLGSTHLPMADIAIDGGPTRYVATGRFGEHGRADVIVMHRGSRFDADASARLVVDRDGGVLNASIQQLSYTARAVTLQQARISYAGAKAVVAGRYEPKGDSDVRASVSAPDLQRITAPWLPRAIPGALELQAQLGGNTDEPKLSVDAHYRHGLLYGMPVKKIDISAQADVAKRTLAAKIDADAGGGSMQVDAKTTLPRRELSQAAFRAGEHALTVHLDRVPLQRIEFWPSGRFIPETVDLSGDLHVQGRIDTLTLQTKLASRMTFPGEPAPVTLAANASYEPRSVELDLNATDQHGPLLRTHIKTDLARDGIARDLPAVQKMIVERSWNAALWVGARRIDQLPAFAALHAPPALWPAQVSIEAKLEHAPGAEPKGQVKLDALWDPPGLKGGDVPCGLSRRPHVQVQLDMRDGALQTETRVTDSGAAPARGGGAAEAGAPMLALKSKSHAPIDEWFEVNPKRVEPASVWLQATDLRLADIPVVCDTATGSVSGTAKLERAMTRTVTVSADLQAQHVQFGKAPPFEAHIKAHADRQIVLANAELSAASGKAVIDANIPLDGGGRMPTLAMDGPARADVVFHHMEAGALLAPVPGVRASAGFIDGSLTCTGTLRDPSLKGAIALDGVTATVGEAGQRFERVTGRIALNGRELHLQPTKIHDREGTLEVSGDVKMVDFQTWQAELEAKADDFPVRRSGVMVARFGGKLGLHANVDPSATQLDVTLSGARVELTGESLAGVQSLSPHEDVSFVDGPPPEQKKPEPRSTPIVVRVQSKDAFWVRREDFSALVDTDLRIEVKDGETNLSGPLVIERGMVELLGQLFDIQSGRITFAGGHQVEPTLELTATRRVPGGSLVTIEASGTLYQPTLNFLVDGTPTTAGEALATATGASAGTGSDSSVQQEMSSMALGIATSVLTVGARRELGEWVPVLALERGDTETRLRAGVEANRFIPHFLRKVIVDAYVEGIFSTGTGTDQSASASAASSVTPDTGTGTGTQSASSAAPPQESSQSVQTEAGVLLELRFPKHLVGEAQYGPGQRWSLDLNWQP